MLLPPGLSRSECGDVWGVLRSTSPVVIRSAQSARAAEGQSFSALSTLELAEPAFPAVAGRHISVGSGFCLPSQLPSARGGLCSVFWDQAYRLPTQPGFGDKRPVKSFVGAHLLGCILETLVSKVWGHSKCHLQGSSLGMQGVRPTPNLLNPGLHVSKIPR